MVDNFIHLLTATVTVWAYFGMVLSIYYLQKPEKPDWVDVVFPFGSTFFLMNCLYYISHAYDMKWWLQILAVSIFYVLNIFVWTKIFNFINRKK